MNSLNDKEFTKEVLIFGSNSSNLMSAYVAIKKSKTLQDNVKDIFGHNWLTVFKSLQDYPAKGPKFQADGIISIRGRDKLFAGIKAKKRRNKRRKA